MDATTEQKRRDRTANSILTLKDTTAAIDRMLEGYHATATTMAARNAGKPNSKWSTADVALLHDLTGAIAALKALRIGLQIEADQRAALRIANADAFAARHSGAAMSR